MWAPTIRHRDGAYHVIVTVMLGGRGSVVFTATDPAGPWSDGVPLPAVDGIDPDPVWDDDGVAHVTYARYPDAIRQVRVDLATGQALEQPVITARSTGGEVQNLGHADLVDTPGGDTVMVLLGVRPLGLARAFSPLGRETFATHVRWVDGWPVAEPVVAAPPAGPDFVTDFASADVLDDPGWIAVRCTPAEVARWSQSRSALTIQGDGCDLGSARPRFVGRRQRHPSATVSTARSRQSPPGPSWRTSRPRGRRSCRAGRSSSGSR